MNCKSENYADYIGIRLREWHEIARIALDGEDRGRAKKNSIQLVRTSLLSLECRTRGEAWRKNK
jgi:hypothetical protein